MKSLKTFPLFDNNKIKGNSVIACHSVYCYGSGAGKETETRKEILKKTVVNRIER